MMTAPEVIDLPGKDPAEGARIMLDRFGREADEIAIMQAAHFMAQQDVEPWRYWRAVREALKAFGEATQPLKLH